MFTKLSHFERAWEFESAGTLKLLRALTDASLAQAVAPEARTLGRLAWHITTSLPEMTARVGLKLAGPGEHDPLPATAAAIAAGYEAASASLVPALLGVPLARVVKRVSDTRDERYQLLRGYFQRVGEEDELEDEQRERLHSVALHEGAPGVGATLAELGFQPLGVEVTAVRRRGIRGSDPSPEMRLEAGDVVVLRGVPQTLEQAERRLLEA